MKTRKKLVSYLLIFSPEGLTIMSLVQKGKQTLLLTMILTGMSPSWASVKSAEIPAQTFAVEPKNSFLPGKNWEELQRVLDDTQNETAMADKNTSRYSKEIIDQKKFFVAGTDLSGGGTSLKVSNPDGTSSRVLLDLYNFGNLPVTSSPGLKLQRTEALKNLGFAKLDLTKTSFYTDFQKSFLLWKSKSPLFMGFLEQALQNISIYYTTYKIQKLDLNTYLPNRSFHQDLEPCSVGFYVKNFGLIISLREIEQLSYENQRAFFLHEIIRHLQIGYGFKMSDKKLQFLVNVLLTANPASVPSLDSVEYFGSQKWSDLNNDNDPLKIASVFKKTVQFLGKYSTQNFDTNLDNLLNFLELINKVRILEQAVEKTLINHVYPEIERCRPLANDCYEEMAKEVFNARILINDLRNIGLKSIINDFSKFVDRLGDATVSLDNARQLDLAIECANKKECTSESNRSRITGALVELLRSGDLIP